ncbi:IS3 family transposase [Micromonospora sp. NPDC003776]
MSKGNYGAARVHVELAAAGLRHGRERVARLMHTAGIVGRARAGGAPPPSRTRRPKRVPAWSP